MRNVRLVLAVLVLTVSALWPAVCRGGVTEVSAGEISGGSAVDRAETSLRLRGTVNAADLDWIAHNCRSLYVLDLSAVTVEPCRLDKGLASGLKEFPGAVLPAYSLAGLSAATLVLPAGITEICDGALLGAAITRLTVPSGVKRIGAGAFSGCGSLEKVDLGDVSAVGPYAFSGCKALTDVKGSGAKLTEIGEKAFAGCSRLLTFRLTSPAPALTVIGDEAFNSTALHSLDLSACAGLRRIGHRVFASCTDLEELRLPDSVSEMGEEVLFGCTSLRDFRLPSAMTEVPAMTLTGASEMCDVSGVLHEGLKTIGAYSLTGLAGVTEVTLPESVGRIDSGAFEGWSALGRVIATRLESVPELGSGVWAGVSQDEADLTVADGMESEFAVADQWKEFRIRPAGESGLELIPIIDQESGVIEARFAGSLLEVTASEELTGVAIYAIDGRLLFMSGVASGYSVEMQTGLPVGQIYIIGLRFAGGKTSGLKLLNEPLR